MTVMLMMTMLMNMRMLMLMMTAVLMMRMFLSAPLQSDVRSESSPRSLPRSPAHGGDHHNGGLPYTRTYLRACLYLHQGQPGQPGQP